MKGKSIVVGVVFCVAVSFSFAFAMSHDAAERGSAHFKNPAFAGGKTACNACHFNGRGLENAGTKTKFNIMGGEQNSLAETVNVCIVNANKGKAIPVDSKEMQEIISYIKTLGQKAAPGYGSPGYGSPGYGK
jgi:cytochrome c